LTVAWAALGATITVGGAGAAPAARGAARKRHGKGSPQASTDAVTAPMQGTIIKVAVADGDTVTAGDLIVVLEAMKMENPVTAHKDGTITSLAAEAGSSVTQGTVICEIKD
jgi:acetyl-CoA/propionyl-CoA carboxylase biotin carboxyl carrier protein